MGIKIDFSVIFRFTPGERQLFILYSIVIAWSITTLLSQWSSLADPQHLLKVGHIALVGYVALIIAPAHQTAGAAVLFPTITLVSLYMWSLWQQGGLAAIVDGDGSKLSFDVVRRLLCIDLWVSRWMVRNFYQNFTAGYNVTPQPDGSLLSSLDRRWSLSRKVLTLLVVVTYFNPLIGLLSYIAATRTIFARARTTQPIDMQQPQDVKAEAQQMLSPVAAKLKLDLTERPVHWFMRLPSPLYELVWLVRLWLSVVALINVALFVLLPYTLYALAVGLSREQQLDELSEAEVHNTADRQATAARQFALNAPALPFPALRYTTSRLLWKTLTTPLHQRGMLWKLRQNVLVLAQIVAFVVPSNSDQPRAMYDGQRGDMAILRRKYRQNTKNRLLPSYSRTNDTDFFPQGLGLGVASWERVAKYLMDSPRKGDLSLGWHVSASQLYFSDYNPVYTSTDKPYLRVERSVHKVWIANFPHQLPLMNPRDTDIASYSTGGTTATTTTTAHLMKSDTYMRLNYAIPRSNQHPPATVDLVTAAISEVIFFLATGGQLRVDEREAYLDVVNNPLSFLPSSINFLVLANLLENQNLQSFYTIMRALARYADGPALTAAFKEAATNTNDQPAMSPQEVLKMVTESFCIAGGVAPSHLAWVMLQRLWGDETGRMKQWWDQKPFEFIVESARLDKCVPLVQVLANPHIVTDVREQLGIDIPENTPIHCDIASANRDPVVFPDPDTFNPDRANLDRVLSWNGSPAAGSAAVRLCPGRWLSISIMHYVVSRFAPVLPSEMKQADQMWDERKTQQAKYDEQQQQEQAETATIRTSVTHRALAVPGGAVSTKEKQEEEKQQTAQNDKEYAGAKSGVVQDTHTHNSGGSKKSKGKGFLLVSPKSASSLSSLDPQTQTPPRTPPPPPYAVPDSTTSSNNKSATTSTNGSASTTDSQSTDTTALPGWLSANEQQYIIEKLAPAVNNPGDMSYLSSGLDYFTRLIMYLMNMAVDRANSLPHRGIDMVAPINLPHKSLQLTRVEQGKFVATFDEDESDGNLTNDAAFKLMNTQYLWPFNDVHRTFESVEEALRWRQTQFSALPPPNIAYDELDSDEAQTRLAFYGQFCHYTQRIDWSQRGIPEQEVLRGRAVYVNDVTALQQFRVRQPYERYGAAAYFDGQRRLIALYWCHEKRLLIKNDQSPDTDWNHVKLVWRTSGFSIVTIRDHLMGLHLTESNTLVNASRRWLSDTHPLRVFLKPFTYKTISINSQAAATLINVRGLVHRVWAFEYDEFVAVCDFCNSNYQFRTLPNWIHPSMRSPLLYTNHTANPNNTADTEAHTDSAEHDSGSNSAAFDWETTFPYPHASCATPLPPNPADWDRLYPIASDMCAYWKIVRDYVERFFDIEYTAGAVDDTVDKHDSELWSFTHDLCKGLGLNGVTSRQQLIDVVAQCICGVTGLHEHVGQISDLLYNPRFINTKLRRSDAMQTVQTYSQHLVLVVLTGLRMPALLDDWTHILTPGTPYRAQHVSNHALFKERLLQRSREVDAANLPAKRIYPFQSFNPRFMECSISV